jgi:hypothetical protein
MAGSVETARAVSEARKLFCDADEIGLWGARTVGGAYDRSMVAHPEVPKTDIRITNITLLAPIQKTTDWRTIQERFSLCKQFSRVCSSPIAKISARNAAAKSP